MRLSAGLLLPVVIAAALWIADTALEGHAAAAPPHTDAAERTIARKQRAQRTQFTDAEITDGFLKVALGSEYQRGESAKRIRKFDGPVQIFIDNRARPDRRPLVASIVADIRSKIAHIDLALTDSRTEANVVVTLTRERDFPNALRARYGAEARKIQQSLDPQCLAGLAKDASFRILRSEVILITDVSNFVFRDCAYEEILQALGPINDVDTVPWTMFNDDVSLGYFGIFDQLLLNILYHPQVKAGMTQDEVTAVLPHILPEIRELVAGRNRIPP